MGNIFIKKTNYQYWEYDEEQKIIFMEEADKFDKEIRKAERDYKARKKEHDSLEIEQKALDKQISDTEREIHQIKNRLLEEETETKTEVLKKELEKLAEAGKQLQADKQDLNKRTWDANEKLATAEAKGRKMAEHRVQAERLCGICFQFSRIRDNLTKKEKLVIQIIRNQEKDGKIVTMLHKLPNEVHLLNEYGIFMPERYFDEFCRIISEHYYDADCNYQDYVDNNIPETTVAGFIKLCMEKMKAKNNPKTGALQYYYIPATEFTKIFEDSRYKKLKLPELKEAGVIYEYIRNNNGRRDLTIAGVGKVIAFYPEKIEELRSGTKKEAPEKRGEEDG